MDERINGVDKDLTISKGDQKSGNGQTLGGDKKSDDVNCDAWVLSRM